MVSPITRDNVLSGETRYEGKCDSISAVELKQVMKNLGDNLSPAEVDDVIREIDLDGDGEIDYQGKFVWHDYLPW